MKSIFALALLSTLCASPGQGGWSPAEVEKVQAFWAQNRYDSQPTRAFVPRFTPEGSRWLWDYNKARGKGKVPPGTIPPAATADEKIWEEWIERRITADQILANIDLVRLNREKYGWDYTYNQSPFEAGPIPEQLRTLVGDPPKFYEAAEPRKHRIRFDDMTLEFEDNLDMRRRFAYYRFRDGVRTFGTKISSLPKAELDRVLRGAGVNESESRILKAVSLLEGGFDSLNTYDTGFISVGFIQFAALAEGGHSLGQTLLQLQNDNPDAYRNLFFNFGVGVSITGLVEAIDLQSGVSGVGAKANELVIKDKRLAAVFARAGKFEPYRIAQVKTAMRMYWPAENEIKVGQMAVKVSEFAKSEALMAALLDRKVNTGNFGPLAEILEAIRNIERISDPSDFGKYEGLILDCVWYRTNPRKDATLSQPSEGLDLPSVRARFAKRS
jgi:hypothetical protein